MLKTLEKIREEKIDRAVLEREYIKMMGRVRRDRVNYRLEHELSVLAERLRKAA